jgi:hypothetical protein
VLQWDIYGARPVDLSVDKCSVVISGSSRWGSFVARKGVTSGNFYFEYEVLRNGSVFQSGWALSGETSYNSSMGVGDFPTSWAYDGEVRISDICFTKYSFFLCS